MKQIPIEPGQSLYVRHCYGCGALKVEDVSERHAPRHEDPDEIRFVHSWVREQYNQECGFEWTARHSCHEENPDLTRDQVLEKLVTSKDLAKHGGWFTVNGRYALCWGCHARYRLAKRTNDSTVADAALKGLRDA